MLNQIKPGPAVLQSIAPIVSKADVAYANLEIPWTDAKTPTVRKSAAEVKAKTQFILKADPRHAPLVAKTGFDAVSLGNNHAMDYRTNGITQMLGLLKDQGIERSGAGKDWADARQTAVVKVGDLKIGFVSFLAFSAPGSMKKCTPATGKTPGVATLTITDVPEKKARAMLAGIVRKAKAECDFVVLCLHWGVERQPQPAAYQVRLGRMLIDAGADMVLGAHPHVLEPGELYRGKPIVYSLGNLISPRPAATALYRFHFEGKKLMGVDFFPAKIGGGKVVLTSTKASRPVGALSAERTLLNRYPNEKSKPLLGSFE